MLRFRVQMTFAPRAADEAVRTLRALVGPVRAEPGCSAARLFRDSSDGDVVVWVEEWGGDADFERHLRSAAGRRIVALVKLSAGEPIVEVDEVVSRRGDDLIAEVLERTVIGPGRHGETGGRRSSTSSPSASGPGPASTRHHAHKSGAET
jgi:quinol monooxygenase YgiN